MRSLTRTARTLTQLEFEQLLQRAAERDVFKEPRLFTLAELVEAGRELAIDPETVRQVHDEYQRGLRQVRGARPPVRQRPVGSTLQLEKRGDSLQFVEPPKPRELLPVVISCAPLVIVGGGVLWFFRDVPMGWSSFALPLAVLGASVGLSVIRHWRRFAKPGHELRLRPDGSGMLLRFRGNTTETLVLQAGQVHARTASEVTTASDGTNASTVTFTALDHGTQTYRLLEGYSHAEQAWLADEIEAWLGR